MASVAVVAFGGATVLIVLQRRDQNASAGRVVAERGAARKEREGEGSLN
jgi:hypothetical protein